MMGVFIVVLLLCIVTYLVFGPFAAFLVIAAFVALAIAATDAKKG